MEGWLSKVVDKGDVTDPYVDVRLGNAKIAKTRFDVVMIMNLFICVSIPYHLQVVCGTACHYINI